MKPQKTHQEVLLVTGTGFTAQDYSGVSNASESKALSENERLQEVCWGGMLKTILPEAFALADPEAKLYLWQMREESHIFALEMGEAPAVIDMYFSIDPYNFTKSQDLN